LQRASDINLTRSVVEHASVSIAIKIPGILNSIILSMNPIRFSTYVNWRLFSIPSRGRTGKYFTSLRRLSILAFIPAPYTTGVLIIETQKFSSFNSPMAISAASLLLP
jgi:hypothetical protein